MKACSESGTKLAAAVTGLLLIWVLPINCSRAIKPSDDIQVGDKTRVIQYGPKAFSASNGAPCRLDVQKDLPKPDEPQPLYLVPETNEVWNPDKTGYLQIPRGASIELHCPNSFANAAAENTTTIKPTCLEGNTFSWPGEKYRFGQFVCTEPPNFVVEPLGKRCVGTGELYRVGYSIAANRFIESMQICYDSAVFRNHYTQHRLFPGSEHFQRNVSRINFTKAGFFGNLNVNSFYTQKNQKKRVEDYFKDNSTVSNLFSGKDMYLARGHLAAKSDFIYANQQLATFVFFNVAPQWQSFNGGQWSKLEIAVRKYVAKMDLEVDCYTGTWGTLSLKSPNNATDEQPFYLAHDSRENGILPVPKLYYRVIVDRANPRRGIALLGVNNPHASMREILDSYVICNDIAANVPWLRWIRNKNLKDGYLYACSAAEFSRVIRILPLILRNVLEILA